MDAFWLFVHDNINVNPESLRLKYHGKDPGFDVALAITQIECRKKFGKKLSDTLSNDPQWLFPSVIAGEQSTSDRLAAFHASLVGDGMKVVDLTVGLGIDAVHFAGKASVTAVEIDEKKANALKYNVGHFNAPASHRINVVCDDCRIFVKSTAEHFDIAFIDPARRADDGSRIFSLSDCQPDVISMLSDIRSIAKRLIIKMSPMLDISHVALSLPHVTRIIALGTPTECKELIADIDFSTSHSSHSPYSPHSSHPLIEAVTLLPESQSAFSFTADQEKCSNPSLVDIKNIADYKYLYEPYPAVMKAAPFRLLSEKYGIDRIAANTNLYLSRDKIEGFPGDVLEIEKIFTYESKHIKRLHRLYPQISVTTRNFPVSAAALQAKLSVKDGGQHRLFAVTASNDSKFMFICR